jgi:hypothetical protein
MFLVWQHSSRSWSFTCEPCSFDIGRTGFEWDVFEMAAPIQSPAKCEVHYVIWFLNAILRCVKSQNSAYLEYVSFSVAQQPNSGLGHFAIELSVHTQLEVCARTRTCTHGHQVGLLWRSDQLITEDANYIKHNTHAPSGIRTRDPSNRAAADRRLIPYGQWDWLNIVPDKLCTSTLFFSGNNLMTSLLGMRLCYLLAIRLPHTLYGMFRSQWAIFNA